MLKESNIEEIEKACDVYTEMCNDKKLMFQAFLREKALHDEASALHDAKQEGKAEGKVEGKAEGKAEERNRAIEILRELGHSEEEIERFYPSFPTG